MLSGPCSSRLRLPWKGADTYGGGVTVFVIHGVMALCSCDCEHPTHVCSPPSHTPTSKSSTELKEVFLPPCQCPQVSASWEELDDVAGYGLVIIPWDVSLLSEVCVATIGWWTWGRQQVSWRPSEAIISAALASITQCVLMAPPQ